MKIRTQENLSDALSSEHSWRVKELRALLLDLKSAPVSRRSTLERAAIALSYAHLEGFFKKAGTLYLGYLANQSCRLSDLEPCFQALCVTRHVRRKYQGSMPTDPNLLTLEALAYLQSNANETAKLSHKAEIKTHSNLSYRVVETVLRQTGVRHDLFSLKEKALDSGLLHARNHVAHGQYLDVDFREVLKWTEMVLEMLGAYKNALENNAATSAWQQNVKAP